MDPQRITAKLLLADAAGLDLETLIPVFTAGSSAARSTAC